MKNKLKNNYRNRLAGYSLGIAGGSALLAHTALAQQYKVNTNPGSFITGNDKFSVDTFYYYGTVIALNLTPNDPYGLYTSDLFSRGDTNSTQSEFTIYAQQLLDVANTYSGAVNGAVFGSSKDTSRNKLIHQIVGVWLCGDLESARDCLHQTAF